MSSMSTSPLPGVVSRNGDLIPPSEATVSVLGNVLYGAWGVYESIQLWDGVIFHLEDHLKRLLDSAAQVELPLAGNLADHARWVNQLIAAEADRPATIRRATIRLFAVGPDEGVGPQSFAWLTPLHAPDAEMVAAGVGAVTYRGERALPNAKSLNTLVNTLARRRATAAGEHEGLLLDRDGNVREGATSNFYIVRNGVLTAPPAADILDGVTLQIVLRLAEEAAIPVERRKIPLADLSAWEEAFLTSTSRHVLPLVRVDGVAVGSGRPGPITMELHRRFEAYFAEYVMSNE
ncbi:MAG: aminotransferase class IV [Caldilineaceae bacterium]|nr:aminotransferase class IV [Caldilineaceae bacterium]